MRTLTLYLHLGLVCVLLMLSYVGNVESQYQYRRQTDASYIHNYAAVMLNDGHNHWRLVQGELKVFHHRGTGITSIISRYLGVPYAAPPVGPLRFAPPQPAPLWTGVLDTLEFRPGCPQFMDLTNGRNESEDCLYLNIYSPSPNRKHPVMVWFHGGGFHSGSASEFDGSSLAANGVVVVTVNYRLGALGLLSTGDDVMPGNYALLDQVLALQWVQQYIDRFGGDPEQVTIFGESSGAACVAMHVLSPLSKGLFNRAIMQSGSSLSPWAVERPGTEVKMETVTRQIAQKVGCDLASYSYYLLSCLTNVSAESIISATQNLSRELDVEILLTPRVETSFGFLQDYPERLIESGNFNNVSTLRGFNSGEYSSYINDPEDDGITRAEFQQIINILFKKYGLEPDVRQYVERTLDNNYLGTELNPMTIRTNLVNVLGDTFFLLPTVLELDKIVNNSTADHFLYQLSYRVRSPANPLSSVPAWKGVLHAEDLDFVFADPSSAYYNQDDSADKAARERIQIMWTNFARFGDPLATPVEEFGVPIQWRKFTSASLDMLNIDIPSSMIPFPRAVNLADYDDILDVLRREKDANSTRTLNAGFPFFG